VLGQRRSPPRRVEEGSAGVRDMQEHVFVYGSLLSGHRYHHVLGPLSPIGRTHTRGLFTMYDLGAYPGLVRGGEAAAVIHGEVYGVDPVTLARLDALEAHPDFYARERTVLGDGPEAWIYLLVPAEASRARGRPVVTGGCWRSHVAARDPEG